MADPIVFESINVNTLNNNASVSVGQNTETARDSHNKDNFGGGMFFGLSYTLNQRNCIFDPDEVDTLISDLDVNRTRQNQQA